MQHQLHTQIKQLEAELAAARLREAELAALLNNTIGVLTNHNRLIAASQASNRAKVVDLSRQALTTAKHQTQQQLTNLGSN